MRRFKTIAVDDEKKARDGIRVLLEKDKEIDLVAICENGMVAIEAIERFRPEILFLDIQMPEINGFEVLNSLPADIMPAVIFTTAYDQYALKAFEIHAIDYLLKPFTDDRFYQALERAKDHIDSAALQDLQDNLSRLLKNYVKSQAANPQASLIQGTTADNSPLTDRLVIKSSGKVYFLTFDEILSIEAQDYFVKIITPSAHYMVRERLKNIATRLPENVFLRVHRSTIVNIRAIRSWEPFFNGDFYLTLTNGKQIKGSRNYRKPLDALLSTKNK